MKEIRSGVLLIAIACGATLILAFDDNAPYCFQFRWLVAAEFNNESERYNCSGQRGVPCIEPAYMQREFPNTTEIWADRYTDQSSLCNLEAGAVCLKYTVSFNNELVNASVFCGKVVEDRVTVITSGCYQQKKDGHTIELCACQSRRGAEPCNASNTISSNFLSLIVFLFVLACIDY
ncbi:uncharacterized protein LOC117222108 [Megalopta genalis]|uniref:uncharacterized protein LOC117222108 n=1 Tax=Megalopta genalis TaxID=115081 RepID=UPI003FD68BC6